MNSPISKLILDMQAKIAADIPAIKFIDLELQQLDQDSPTVLFPCLLIDIGEISFTQFQTHQDGKVIVQMKLATQSLRNTSENTPLAVRELELEIFEIEQQIYQAFQYWNNVNALSGEFIRTSSSNIKQADSANAFLKIRLIQFECSFTDLSAEG
jgi:hypothetical protein